MLRFDNKTVVVTGASSGIGKAAAIMFAKQGAKVVATYNNNPKGADDAVAKIQAAGGTAMAYGLNISKSKEVDALAAAAVKEFGAIDAWINNAGKVAPPKELKDVTDQEWEDMLAVDLDGCFYGSRAAAKQMIAQGRGGRIVNVSSIHGTLSEPAYGPYTAAKGGVEAFTRTLATELARYKITCNTIAPGATFTELTVPMYTESVKKALFERISLKEIAEADWIASAILFLASEEARYITGTVLYVDGGYVMDGSLPGCFLLQGVNMGRYIDISVPVSSGMTVYPGDPLPQVFWPHWSREKGDPANVGIFHGGLHHGTHVDAPWHFVDGAKLDEIPLDRWLGPCWVADLTHESQCVSAASLEDADIPPDTTRLLLKTRNSQSDYWREPWNPQFIYIHRSAAEWCVQAGVRTVGLDYLTVDPPQEPTFPAHCILLGNDVVLIEYINLRHVAAGPYELIAAPINVAQADGAWCRALLFQES